MQNQFGIVCRGSLLARAQAELFKKRLLEVSPDAAVQIVIQDTAGDRNQEVALQEIEGRDFFTKDIQAVLQSGQADFAVHSLKDVSGDNFFGSNHFAILEREDPRDAVIFNSNIEEKIREGKRIRIGTSSPRRALMAIDFLRQALPFTDENSPEIEAVPIRGNVDTRLRKLKSGEYDGIILAVAGLNRLLRFHESHSIITDLLLDKRQLVLPLLDCPPAPGQGAVVVETTATNTQAIEILERINQPALHEAVKAERALAHRYGSGCHQQFGTIHVDIPKLSFTYGGGVSKEKVAFTEYRYKKPDVVGKIIFSMGDFMKRFFKYTFHEAPTFDRTWKSYFIASHKAVHSTQLIDLLKSKRIWAAGTKTWFQLARKGIWVEGCADGLGLAATAPWLSSPLIQLSAQEMIVLTDTDSVRHWLEDGWKAAATMTLSHDIREDIVEKIRVADIIFWTSFRQFQYYKPYLKQDVLHCCGTGKTADLLLKEGIAPAIFPGIKAFNAWRKENTTVRKDV